MTSTALIKRDWDLPPSLISKMPGYWANPTQNFVLLHSGALFSEPDFRQGLARIFDLGANLPQFNLSATPDQADTLALYSDWLAVGDDLYFAIGSYR